MTKEMIKKTEEIKVAELTLEQRLAEVDGYISTLNKALKAKDIDTINVNIPLLEASVKTYNTQLRESEYKKFLTTETPVLTALKQGTIKQIKVSVKRSEDKPDEYKRGETWSVLDLLEFDNYAGTNKKIFPSGQWKHRIELWNHALKAWKAKSLDDTEAISSAKELIKQLNSDEDVKTNFTFSGTISKNMLVKTAQIIVDNIVVNPDSNAKPFIFEGKDLEYVALGFRSSSKNILKYASMRTDTCIKMFTRALHRIVTSGVYTAEEQK